MFPKIILKPGREASLLRHHPWIFSGAIQKTEGSLQTGDTADIFSSKGQWLCRAAYSPQSQIRARAWTFDEKETVDAGFLKNKIQRSVENRVPPAEGQRAARRLVYGESDDIPGLIVDRYANFLTVQFLSAGAEKWKNEIIDALKDLLPNEGIYERSDAAVREKEGLTPTSGLCAGNEPPPLIEILEDGCSYFVNIREGHKTGFYLDQRENRNIVANYAARKSVLNCFSYTGGFGIAALKAGAAHVTNIDTSADALLLAEKNLSLNGLDASRMANTTGDVFALLRHYRAEKKSFDIIILDPPKFAESVKHLDKAARGYKDVNRVAFEIVKPGGLLITFSCSGLLEPSLFQKIVSDAALDAGRQAQIIHYLHQTDDHPVSLNFPEAAYLKGFVCKAL